jgi:hypothetical protein
VIPLVFHSMVGLSDLDFSPGLEIQRVVKDRFSSPVSFHPSSPSPEFLLVATFGRSAIRRNVASVSLILQSCLEGVASDYNVSHLSGMCFRFSVFSKQVGFLVYRLGFFKRPKFAVFFDLWGNGGPNWQRELSRWTSEEEKSWSFVAPKSSRKTYA